MSLEQKNGRNESSERDVGDRWIRKRIGKGRHDCGCTSGDRCVLHERIRTALAFSKQVERYTRFQSYVVCGGFPCQDISTAGKGKGIKEGNRSGLWFEMLKTICLVRPKYIIIENVPAITTRGLDIVLCGLAEAGYDAEWFTLQASDFGALHKRERMFIIAYNIHTDNDKFDKERKVQGGASSSNKRIETFVTHDWIQRIQRFKQKTFQEQRGFSWCKDVRRVEDMFGRPDIPQPLFRGSGDGIPDWVDRVKACGNAVIPQAAEFIGRRLMEIEMSELIPKRTNERRL